MDDQFAGYSEKIRVAELYAHRVVLGVSLHQIWKEIGIEGLAVWIVVPFSAAL